MVHPKSSTGPALFSSRRKPPPNYFSRRVQVRVLILVFLLLAVMKLMDEARRPDNWKWIWQFEQATSPSESPSPLGAESPAGDPSVNTRPPLQPATETPAQPVVTVPTNRIFPQDLLHGPLEQSLHGVQLRGWTTVLDSLGPPQRELFQQGLWDFRHQRGLGSHEAGRWPELCDELTRQWTQFQTRARQAVEQAPHPNQIQLTEAQQRLCDEVLVALENRWQQQLAALREFSEHVAFPHEPPAPLAELQDILDERAWQAVEDNTVLRSAENEAWYRSWEHVESPAADRSAADATPVSFVQLFSQPAVYRGQSVQVQGTARLGYHVASRAGRFGIDGYYVLWIRPADGTDSPFAAYVRTLPAGFPPLAERVPNQDGTPLREEVTVTGLFFKRWLYSSRGGPNLAPLVLGQVTQWTPPVAEDRRAEWLSVPRLVALVLTMAGVGLGCGAWLYGRTRRSTPDVSPSPRMPDELPPFEIGSFPPSVEESLRHMNREDEHA
ncbi:MAG: hypothetical protein ACYC3X_02980 [Pirellulaceae bacterium]